MTEIPPRYTDHQMKMELLHFFKSWRPKDVDRMTPLELAAWKKHAVALRDAGFWWEQGS